MIQKITVIHLLIGCGKLSNLKYLSVTEVCEPLELSVHLKGLLELCFSQWNDNKV